MGTLGKTWKLSDEAKENHRKSMAGKGVGRKLSKEHKANISKSISGERNPMKKLENRIKMSRSHKAKGVNHHAYKGGVSTTNELARKSQEYRLWREAVFRRDDYTCQDCGVRSGNGKKVTINADHIKPFSLFPELRFAIDNGRTLCVTCHKKTDTYGVNKKYKAVDYLKSIIT